MIQCRIVDQRLQPDIDHVLHGAQWLRRATRAARCRTRARGRSRRCTLPLSVSGPSRLFGTLSRNCCSMSGLPAPWPWACVESRAQRLDQRPGFTTLATSRPTTIATSVLSASKRISRPGRALLELRVHQRLDDREQDQRRRAAHRATAARACSGSPSASGRPQHKARHHSEHHRPDDAQIERRAMPPSENPGACFQRSWSREPTAGTRPLAPLLPVPAGCCRSQRGRPVGTAARWWCAQPQVSASARRFK